jgi:hypothetical protein
MLPMRVPPLKTVISRRVGINTTVEAVAALELSEFLDLGAKSAYTPHTPQADIRLITPAIFYPAVKSPLI